MKKHIKLFEEYTEQQDGHPGFYETEEEIHAWLEQNDGNYRQNTYNINDDWSVDVNENVDIANEGLTYIRIKFNEVKGYFDCSGNNLQSLEGAPAYVGRGFGCTNNNLTTLKGAPQKVGKSFICDKNKLTSLEYIPTKIYGNFYCSENNLKSLKYAPDYVGGCFNFVNNELTTFQYSPDYVGKGFYWIGNDDLVTLGHKSDIQGTFHHDPLKGTIEERVHRYIDYLNTLDEQKKKSSLSWLRDVDEEFHKSVVEYALNNDINLPGVDKNIASDALKHKDSGLF